VITDIGGYTQYMKMHRIGLSHVNPKVGGSSPPRPLKKSLQIG